MTWKQMKTAFFFFSPPRQGKKCLKLTAVQEMQPLLSSLTVGVDTLFGEAVRVQEQQLHSGFLQRKSANHSLLAQPVASEVTVFPEIGEYFFITAVKVGL